jgi:hypothetical protein
LLPLLTSVQNLFVYFCRRELLLLDRKPIKQLFSEGDPCFASQSGTCPAIGQGGIKLAECTDRPENSKTNMFGLRRAQSSRLGFQDGNCC